MECDKSEKKYRLITEKRLEIRLEPLKNISSVISRPQRKRKLPEVKTGENYRLIQVKKENMDMNSPVKSERITRSLVPVVKLETATWLPDGSSPSENEPVLVKREILESDEEESQSQGDTFEEMSDYEKLRERNIQEKMRMFQELQLNEAKENLKSALPSEKKVTQRGLKVKREKSPPPPPRKSLRLQGKTPSGDEMSLHEPQISIVNGYKEIDRTPGGQQSFETFCNKPEDLDKYTMFVSDVQKDLCFGVPKELTGDLDSFKKTLKNLKITPEQVAKVIPDRIFSVAVHPSETRLLTAAGGKWGNLGIWDVNSTDSYCDGVYTFLPHAKPLNYMSFCKFNPSRLFTTSYDGTARVMDIENSVFDEVYSSRVDQAYNWLTWHSQLSDNVLLYSQGTGRVLRVDTRSPKKLEGVFYCYPRSVRTVCHHPLQEQYFLTASGLGLVDIWDQRYFNKRNPKSVSTMPHKKSMSSALFSPISGSYVLTTCMDHRLRLYDTSNLAVKNPNVVANIIHNNFTGRWLTTFKAMWHPHREDTFVVGSMERPRQIEIFGIHGQMIHKLDGEDLSSVCSIVHFHPTLPVVVGGNSSGRVHVFK